MALEEREREQLQRLVDAPLLTHPDKLLEGKSVLISGATRLNGIGFAIAERFALEGATHLVLVGTRQSEDETPFVEKRLKRYGVDTHILIGDVTDVQSVKEMMGRAYKFCDGNVNIVVNNAGVTRDKEFTEFTVDDYRTVMDTKALGAFLMTQEWFRLRNEDYSSICGVGGRVINIGSIVGEYGNSGQEPYAMANGSLTSLTRNLSDTLGRRRITVNLIAPGFVEGTNITARLPKEVIDGVKGVSALNMLVRPDDIAWTALYLAGPYAERVTGAVIPVDCGIQSNYVAVRRLHLAGFVQIPRPLINAVRTMIGEHLRSRNPEGST